MRTPPSTDRANSQLAAQLSHASFSSSPPPWACVWLILGRLRVERKMLFDNRPPTVCTEANVKPRYRWSLGSVLFLASWAVMMGPMTYGRHLLSAPRLPFTVAYFGSIGFTLYFSLGVSLVRSPVCCPAALLSQVAKNIWE